MQRLAGGFSSEKLNYSSLSNRVRFFTEQLVAPKKEEGFDHVLNIPATKSSIDQILGQIDSVLTEEKSLPLYKHPTSDPPTFTGVRNMLRAYLKEEVPSNLAERVYFSNCEFVAVYDAYPKAKVHLLIMPRPEILDCKDLSSVSAANTDVVSRMHALAEKIITQLQASHGGDFRAGYHVSPSLEPLHLHVISQEFDSACLKKKKHWNSFTTDFFVPAEKALAMIKSGELGKLEAKADALLATELRCHKCKQTLPNMPGLKEHISTCKAESK